MRLTTSGIVFLIAGATLSVAAYRFSLPGLLPAGILLIVLVAASLALAYIGGTRMAVTLSARTRTVDDMPLAAVGEPLAMRASVHNRSPLPVGAFEIVLEPADGFGETARASIPGMAAGARITVEATFVPRRRGISGIGAVRTIIDGPFRLTTVTKTIHGEHPVAVATRIHTLPRPHSAGAARPMSESPQLVRGDSSRDFHTREYVPGDDLRHIHWPSTAKTGEFMVRQEAVEETPFVAVILDTAGAEPADPSAELLISGAASIARAYMRAGYDILFYAGGTRTILAGRPGDDRLRMATARYSTGDPDVPRELGRLGAVIEAVVCALTAERADLIAARLPRATPRRRIVADEAPEADELGTEVFGEAARLPAAWTRLGRRTR